MTERTALVTGGSTGIGESICRHFLDSGFEVINLARRAAGVESPRLHDYAVDLADREATRAVAAEVRDNFTVDTLVHNAGLIRADLVEDVKLEDLDYLSEIHLATGITLLQACLPAMKEKRFGRVINMSSRALLGLDGGTYFTSQEDYEDWLEAVGGSVSGAIVYVDAAWTGYDRRNYRQKGSTAFKGRELNR